MAAPKEKPAGKRNEGSVLSGAGGGGGGGSGSGSRAWQLAKSKRLFWCLLGPPVHTFKGCCCVLTPQRQRPLDNCSIGLFVRAGSF